MMSALASKNSVAKALLKASDELGLQTIELVIALGVDCAAINQLKISLSIEPESKQGAIHNRCPGIE